MANSNSENGNDGKPQGNNTARRLAAGAGLLAGAAAAAGYYYFYASKDAKKNRRIVSKWADDFKRDVAKTASDLRSIDRAAIVAAVDRATRDYTSVRGVKREDVTHLASELKKNWKHIAEELHLGTKKRSRSAKKRVQRRKS